MTSKNNEHYSAPQWADFVNGQLSEPQRQSIQCHLDGGCRDCSKSLEFWRGIEAAAEREALYLAPDWVLRYVQNAFIVANQPRRTATAKLRIPRLVLDSFWQPALVGVRSAAAAETPRHLVYKSDQIAVELQLEPERNNERVNVSGQISNLALGGEGLGQIPVRLSNADGEVAQASTNKLGEFRLTFVPEQGLEFAVDLGDGEQLAIPFSEAVM